MQGLSRLQKGWEQGMGAGEQYAMSQVKNKHQYLNWEYFLLHCTRQPSDGSQVLTADDNLLALQFEPERWRSRGAEGPGIVGLPGDLAGAVELKRPRAAWEVGSRSRAAGDGSRRGTQLESADDAYKIKDPRRRQEE
ncbi:hypothetical protein NDU88_002818 [Pleurodeles waltl]|uniref:Uncharacterized protein n=1 Tax=Pleurodeles waltl TaxID=8319 RepID=A0AAV7NN16_PLEWA|nr:hypothetical protein NDU88_002818 [Pleurodeles waltl]